MLSHSPGDLVYVRDVHYEWLPAVVEEVPDDGDRVLVRIDLPKEWKSTTLLLPKDTPLQERWISLQDYDDGRLPLQNSIQCRDMAELTHLHEAEILYQIKQRHCQTDRPYTRVGDMMVAMNPCRWIHSLYTMEQQNFYFEHFAKPNPNENSVTATFVGDEKKDSLADEPAFVDAGTLVCSGRDYDRLGCEPHIYEVSSLAFRGLIEHQVNQTILVSGESGSGKTETVKLVLKHIASLRPSQSSAMLRKYDDDLISHVLASSPIFEAFGNAKTLFNANSSRFGKVTQLYFSSVDHGASLVGSSFSSYLLELNRVVSHSDGERNFHIFYQMLSAPSNVKTELLGPDWSEATSTDFRYLRNNQSGIKEEMLDASNWTYTLKALIMFGWDGSALEQLMRALGIILLIGNIEFREENENKASIVQEADLFILSASIGVPVEELELALTQRTIQTAQDLLLVPFSPEQANEACEALSKTIYAGVVASIVRQINYLTSVSPSFLGIQNSISLVDIFGFESYESNNRFDQFCINFANERLQQKYVFDNIRRHVTEYELEGIVLPDWQDIDNSSTVHLFEGPSGLIKSLNEQCIRPNGTSDTFVSIVKQLNKTHERFVFDNLHSSKEFGVHHFAGPVIYDASMFVERNTEKLPDFLISVAATSTNTLLSQVLGEVMKERTVATHAKRKVTKKTVIDVFQTQLKDLLHSIEGSQSRYIKCIKPCNNLEVIKKIDHEVVLRQLRCSGLVAAIKLSRETFPNKLLFSTIARRFSCLLSAQTLTSTADMDVHDRTQVILSTVFAPLIEAHQERSFSMPFACGRTKVFFRTGALETLERKRLDVFHTSASKIQQIFRGFYFARRYHRLRAECIRVQARIRCFLSLIRLKQVKRLVINVQARRRSAPVRKRFLKMLKYITCIQRWWASVSSRLRTKRQIAQVKTASSVRIAKWYASLLQSRRLKAHQRHGLVIYTWIKARLQRTFYLRKKRAAIVIAAWSRGLPIRIRFKLLKKVAIAVSSRRRLQRARQSRASKIRAIIRIQTIVRSRQQMKRYSAILKEFKLCQRMAQERRAVTKLQHFVRLKQRAARENAAWCQKNHWTMNQDRDAFAGSKTCPPDREMNFATIASDNADDPEKSVEVLLVPALPNIDEQLLLYRRQIEDLKNDITLLTSEAELHKQEVEADFEERLAEYEEEVLHLKQSIFSLEAERVNLKDEVAANVMIVGNLKTGIRSMQEAHREYLNKVMRAIDNANIEHQRALELVKRDRDDKVEALSKEVKRLNEERVLSKGHNLSADSANIYELARKIENLTAPNVIAALCKKTKKLPINSKEDYIDEKLSGKIRRLLYRIEDIAATSYHDPIDQQRYILSLEQQLADAKHEMSGLKGIDRNADSGNQLGRLRLKKFFER